MELATLQGGRQLFMALDQHPSCYFDQKHKDVYLDLKLKHKIVETKNIWPK